MLKFIRILRYLPILFIPFACTLSTQEKIIPVASSPTPPTASKILASPTVTEPESHPSASPTPVPTLPTATLKPPPTPPPTVSPVQLNVFEELWQIINEEYLYADFNGVDWNAVHDEYRLRIEAGLSNEDFYAAMDEMVKRLGDEHSMFFNPEQAAEEDAEYAGDYDYVGIGILTVVVPERERIAIIAIFPNSPAEEAGLNIRDSIMAVDGHPIFTDNDLHRDLLRGAEGTFMTLTVQTPGKEPRDISIQRQRISGMVPVPYEVLTTPDGKRIGYISLITFGDSTIVDQVAEALKEMSARGKLDGLILDNRMNSGGASTVLHGALSFFTQGTLGYYVNRQQEEPLYVDAVDVNGSQEIPLVVLIGRDTVSFGEVFAGILQDTGRAYLIGEKTDGNVEILYIYDFEDGSRAWIAHDTFRPLIQTDQVWEETGILPNLEIVVAWDEVTLDEDPAVYAALEYFDEN